jgi:hypothetical protein
VEGGIGMAKKPIFAEQTPLGHRVVLTRDRWREIIRFKHPALKGHEQDAGLCVSDPDLIRASSKDPDVHLYYRGLEQGHICLVVAGDDLQNRFVVTAYRTETIKKGPDLWTK